MVPISALEKKCYIYTFHFYPGDAINKSVNCQNTNNRNIRHVRYLYKLGIIQHLMMDLILVRNFPFFLKYPIPIIEQWQL